MCETDFNEADSSLYLDMRYFISLQNWFFSRRIPGVQ